jgi:hypothetical protein
MSSQNRSPALAVETITIQNALAGDACLVFRMGSSPAAMEDFTEAVEARFADCNLTLQTSSTAAGRATTSEVHVALDRLDPSRVTVRSGLQVPTGWSTTGDLPLFSIHFVSSENAEVISVKTERIEVDKPPQSETHNVSELNIRVKSQESAAKIAAAFQRAIALCGGTRKSTEPSK